MNNQLNNEVINDEPFSLYSLFQYVKENLVGLSLLLLSVIIVIIVDYISRYNSMIFAIPSPIPGATPPQPPQVIKHPIKVNKGRKFKKR